MRNTCPEEVGLYPVEPTDIEVCSPGGDSPAHPASANAVRLIIQNLRIHLLTLVHTWAR
jgi:hypothetical protein